MVTEWCANIPQCVACPACSEGLARDNLLSKRSAALTSSVAVLTAVRRGEGCSCWRRCARGSLFDVLQKASRNPALAPQLDWPRRLNIALDAAKVLGHSLNGAVLYVVQPLAEQAVPQGSNVRPARGRLRVACLCLPPSVC